MITDGQDILASDFISSSAGAADVGKVPKLNASGLLDGSFLPTSKIVRTYTTNMISLKSYFWTVANVGGNTWRYTCQTAGIINATTFPIGSVLSGRTYGTHTDTAYLIGVNFNGDFVTTGVGTNYFEITNASGSAQTNKQPYDRCIWWGFGGYTQTWTKPANLKALKVKMVGGGGGAQRADSGNSNAGFSGAYCEKTYLPAELSTNETFNVGVSGVGGVRPSSSWAINSYYLSYQNSAFKSMLAGGGIDGTASTVYGASGGDINISTESRFLDSTTTLSGGNGKLGKGGLSGGNNGENGGGGGGTIGAGPGGMGGSGLVILEEYY